MKNREVPNQKAHHESKKNKSKKIDISDLTEAQVNKFSFKLSQCI